MTDWNDLIDHLMPTLPDVDWKVASYLWEFTKEGTVPVHRTQGNIAAQTGLSRATIGRVLLRLVSRRIISVKKEWSTEPLTITWTWAA